MVSKSSSFCTILCFKWKLPTLDRVSEYIGGRRVRFWGWPLVCRYGRRYDAKQYKERRIDADVASTAVKP